MIYVHVSISILSILSIYYINILDTKLNICIFCLCYNVFYSVDFIKFIYIYDTTNVLRSNLYYIAYIIWSTGKLLNYLIIYSKLVI